LTPETTRRADIALQGTSQEIIVEMPSWLRWLFGARSSDPKAADLQEIRRQTDQKLKRQKAEKKEDEARDIPSKRGGEPRRERPD
jgi:hypothetical protein